MTISRIIEHLSGLNFWPAISWEKPWHWGPLHLYILYDPKSQYLRNQTIRILHCRWMCQSLMSTNVASTRNQTQDSVLEEVQRELEVELSRGRKLENLIITAPVSEASGFKQVVATQTIFWGVTPKIGGNDPNWLAHSFQMGWFNHQLDNYSLAVTRWYGVDIPIFPSRCHILHRSYKMGEGSRPVDDFGPPYEWPKK